jgi:hypothetical protein
LFLVVEALRVVVDGGGVIVAVVVVGGGGGGVEAFRTELLLLLILHCFTSTLLKLHLTNGFVYIVTSKR